MLNSVRGRMALIFLAFAALVTVSVAASYWIIETQTQDALVINLAGRQRMLIQQMTTEALQLEKSGDSASRHQQAAQSAAATFQQTLHALRAGGQAPYLPQQPAVIPATRNPAILNTLTHLEQTWHTFQRHLTAALETPPGSRDFTAAINAIEQTAPNLVQQADVAVRLFENESAQKVARLRQVQIVFFASALILLVAGVWVTQKSVVEPLWALSAAAARIGSGDLQTPVAGVGPEELQRLSGSFDGMRARLQTSQEELEAQVRQRTRELANAFEFSQEIVAELELERLLASVTDRAKNLLDARAASLCLLTPAGDSLTLKASSGLPTPPPAEITQSADRLPIARHVVRHGQTITVETACANCRVLQGHAPGQCVASPLRSGEQTLGALCVVRARQHQFDAAETRALALLANSAATAIANANLIQAGQQQARETASLAERERLAADLHDNLAQTLSFLNLKTDQLKELIDTRQPAAAEAELNWMKSAIGAAYGQVRAALVGLREPVTPAEGDLAANLRACLADLRHVSKIAAELAIVDDSALKLSAVGQKQALHIVKESLNNAWRHAQAQHIEVRIERQNGHARFTIRDDGRGFDPARLGGGSHYGLTIMRARAERVGGSLHIESAPNGGTTIIAQLPLESRN